MIIVRPLVVMAAAFGVAAGAFWPVGADALELVAGGYGTTSTEEPAAPVDEDPLRVSNAAAPGGLALDFTPRGASLWSKAEDGMTATPQFSLTVRGTPTAVDRLGLVSSYDGLHGAPQGPAPAALTVGGAMKWSDWSFGGGVGRAQVLGEDLGVMSANVSYGRISTELAYGQAESAQGATKDVLMLSTDLAAWSWLTLESDLAVGTGQNAVDRERDRNSQPVAAGRFGLRLNF